MLVAQQTMPSAMDRNQLQFNLDVPIVANNLSVRFHKPNPIVIERYDGQTREQSAPQQQKSFEFSTVSQDKMSLAVKLAQRDVKKKKWIEEMQSMSALEADKTQKQTLPKRVPLSSRTKTVYSKDSKGRLMRQEQNCRRKDLKVREVTRSGEPKTAQTQVSVRSKFDVRHESPQRNQQSQPGTTNSPPTRDTDNYPPSKSRLDTGGEILRLRKELEGYLQQIQVIEQRAVEGVKSDDRTLDKEEETRRNLRVEEQAARSSRTLYSLRQQVREIQEELLRIGKGRLRATKKQQTLSRLATAHRGVVRAVQTLVSSLSDTRGRVGLPTAYHELALLIRQLTMLCAQLDVGAEYGLQDELIRMLDRVDELNKAWHSGSAPESKGGHRSTYEKKVKENKLKGVVKTAEKSRHTLPDKQQYSDAHVTDDRRSTLQAGIAALLHTGDEQPQVRTSRPQAEDRPSRPRAEERPSRPKQMHDRYTGKPTVNRGILLPPSLQAKREKVQKNRVAVQATLSHFADPTIAANLKSNTVLTNPITEERSLSAPPSPSLSRAKSKSPSRQPWKPGGTRSRSPASIPHRGRPCSPESYRSLSPDLEHGDIIKKLRFIDDDEKKVGMHTITNKNGKHSREAHSYFSNRGPNVFSEQLVQDAEDAVRTRLQPLLDQAKKIAQDNEEKQLKSRQSLRNKLSEKVTENVAVNVDVLSDMILHDLLRDTVDELQSHEQQAADHSEAVTMQDAPSLETMYQRLSQMEDETLEIKQRWHTVDYSDPERAGAYHTKAGYTSDQPASPAAMEITKHQSRTQPSGQPDAVQTISDPSENSESLIVFTKSVPQSRTEEKYIAQGSISDDGRKQRATSHNRKTQCFLPKHLIENIHENVAKYERHLRRSLHHSTGQFDPWGLVEEVADEILEECLQDIADELQDVSDDIVNHVYRSEFIMAQSETPSPDAPQARSAEDLVNPMHDEFYARNLLQEYETAAQTEQVKERLPVDDISDLEARSDAQHPASPIYLEKETPSDKQLDQGETVNDKFNLMDPVMLGFDSHEESEAKPVSVKLDQIIEKHDSDGVVTDENEAGSPVQNQELDSEAGAPVQNQGLYSDQLDSEVADHGQNQGPDREADTPVQNQGFYSDQFDSEAADPDQSPAGGHSDQIDSDAGGGLEYVSTPSEAEQNQGSEDDSF